MNHAARRRTSRPFLWDAVIKVGGSLGSRPARLRPLLRRIADLARREHVLVLPGGGRFADLVRTEMERLRLTPRSAHAMALLGMDQYGLMLADLEPRLRPAASLAVARREAERGRAPVLLASTLVGRAPGLERSFRLTSDSIAAWLAGRVQARRLLLLKSVPGLDLAIGGRPAAREAARRGLVDPLFARLLPAGIEARLVDARAPAGPPRLSGAAGGRRGRR